MWNLTTDEKNGCHIYDDWRNSNVYKSLNRSTLTQPWYETSHTVDQHQHTTEAPKDESIIITSHDQQSSPTPPFNIHPVRRLQTHRAQLLEKTKSGQNTRLCMHRGSECSTTLITFNNSIYNRMDSLQCRHLGSYWAPPQWTQVSHHQSLTC